MASSTSASTTVTLTGAQTVTANLTPTPAATVSLTPATLTFSAVAGTPSAVQTVALKNTGTAALTISSITLTGTNAGLFAQTNTCGTSVAAGATCTVAVTFTPPAAGSYTATLGFTDNVAASPQSVTLTGTATTAASFSLSAAPASRCGLPGSSRDKCFAPNVGAGHPTQLG